MKEEAGRLLDEGASDDRRASHLTIGRAIDSAGESLTRATSLPWRISRDSHYQMSNRFAWAWKLTECGIPVVLIYLGFLNAGEMRDRGKLLASAESWEALVKAHSAPLFSEDIWNRRWSNNGVPFIPVIRAVGQPLVPGAVV